jgi:peptide-methionine (S)-S-oxide reductase
MSAKATFAAGCFWGVEADFRAVEGVLRTTVGYTGGSVANPSYELVCTDTTGHAEAVEVEYDPSKVSYEDLLAVFWKSHDPTQVNRQGPDVGRQYRSVIFVHGPDQEVAATRSKAEVQAGLPRPVATEIVPATEFYPAEDYHQRYLEKRGLASCTVTLKGAEQKA